MRQRGAHLFATRRFTAAFRLTQLNTILACRPHGCLRGPTLRATRCREIPHRVMILRKTSSAALVEFRRSSTSARRPSGKGERAIFRRSVNDRPPNVRSSLGQSGSPDPRMLVQGTPAGVAARYVCGRVWRAPKKHTPLCPKLTRSSARLRAPRPNRLKKAPERSRRSQPDEESFSCATKGAEVIAACVAAGLQTCRNFEDEVAPRYALAFSRGVIRKAFSFLRSTPHGSR